MGCWLSKTQVKMERDIEGWQIDEEKVEDKRAVKKKDNCRGTHSCSYKGGSYKKGRRGDIKEKGLKCPI